MLRPSGWRHLLRALRGLAGAILLTTCSTDTALAPGTRVDSRFDASSLFRLGGEYPIPIDEVVLELRRVSDNGIAFSRTLTAAEYAQSGDQLIITVSFDLTTSPEDFTFIASVRSGGVEYYRATGSVTATAGRTTSTPPLTPVYTGPGGTADSIDIAPLAPLGNGEVATLSATVLQGGTLVAGVPVAFGSSDSSLIIPLSTGLSQAAVTAPLTGSGSVTITAKTPTGLSRSTTVSWAPRAVAIVKISGDVQNVPVGTAAALPLVVEVRDGQGTPVAGVDVTFAVTAGSTGTSVNPTSATTDVQGRAQTSSPLGMRSDPSPSRPPPRAWHYR